MKWLAVAVFAAAPLCAGTAVDRTAARFDRAVAKAPGTAGAEFRALGCKALKQAPCETPAPAARGPRRTPSGAAAAIREKMKPLRSLATDADRARARCRRGPRSSLWRADGAAA